MNDIRSQLEQTLDAGFTEATLKTVRKQLSDITCDMVAALEDSIKTDIAYNIAASAERMADDAIEAMLNGDEEKMRRALHCAHGYWTGRDKDHPVIHGKLFETGCIETRKQIVDAYPELLKNERILDLEDQVRSLVAQMCKLEARNSELVDRQIVEYNQ